MGHPCWVGAPPVDELIVLGPWTAGVARAVTRAKLAGRREVLLAAGALVGEVVATRDTGVEAIVALPTDRRRARSRGRDHTRELVRGVARVLDRPVLRPFAPVTGSADRVGVGGRDLAPTVPTFVVADPTASIGRRLLLVDDVVTTGTTLAAAATTLCQAGAVVVGAVIGRAGGHELRPPGAAVSR